jgi:CYTH domain-containing protein
MEPDDVRYTRFEYERRFLVAPHTDWRSVVAPYAKTFEDKYLRGGNLRLRILTDSDTGRRVLKLNKKAESESPYFRRVSRLLLSPGEYEVLDRLEGNRLRKIRYYHHHRGRVFSIDVLEGELDGLVLCETEADGLDELMAVEPPAFVKVEVTEDPFFTGGNLCRTTRAELLQKLSAFV